MNGNASPELQPAEWQIEGNCALVRHSKPLFQHAGFFKIEAGDQSSGIFKYIPYDARIRLYKLTARVRTDFDLVCVTRIHVGVDYYSADDKFLGEEYVKARMGRLPYGLFAVAGKTGWTPYVAYFGRNVPKETTRIRLWATVNLWETPGARGSAYVSELSVSPLEPDPNWPLGYPPVRWKTDKKPSYSDSAKKDKYIVYPVNYLRIIPPEMTSDKSCDVLTASTYSFPGADEPVSFCMQTIADIDDIAVNVSDLKTTNSLGFRISADSIDVRRVVYLFKKSHCLRSEYMKLPVYLEPFEKISVPKGSTQQFWLTVKTPKDAHPGIYCGTITVRPKTAPPKTIDLTFEVLPIRLITSSNVAFGVYYYGKNKYQMLRDFSDMQRHGMTTVVKWSAVVECESGNTGVENVELKPDGTITFEWSKSKGLPVEVDLYHAVGFSAPLIVYGNAYYSCLPQTCQQNGSNVFSTAYRSLMKQLKDELIRRKAPDTYFASADEDYPYPFGTDRFRITRMCDPILKELGIKTAVHALNHPTPQADAFRREFYSSYDLLLLRFCHPPVCGSEQFLDYASWPQFKDSVKSAGKKLFLYNMDNTGLHPETMRFGYGVATWIKGVDGMINWHYQCPVSDNPYDEMSVKPGLAHFMLYYPSNVVHQGGPSLAWEAVREGVKDYQLLYTLRRLSAEARRPGGNPDLKMRAESAEKEIAAMLSKIGFSRLFPESNPDLPGAWAKTEYGPTGEKFVSGDYKLNNGFSFEDYDRLRRVICDAIIALQPK